MEDKELREFLTNINNKMDQFSTQLANHTEQASKTEKNLATLTESFNTFKDTFEKSLPMY